MSNLEIVRTHVRTHDERLYASVGNLIHAFDSTVSMYLDGVPKPKHYCDSSGFKFSYDTQELSSACRESLHSTVDFVPLWTNQGNDVGYSPLCTFSCSTTPSCRIGNHFSLLVGGFSFKVGPATRVPVVPVARRSLKESRGHLPLTTFIELLEDESVTCEVRALASFNKTFLTTDPDELKNFALCKVSCSDKTSSDFQWELCEIVHADPNCSSFRVRMTKTRLSSGELVEKHVSRSALALSTSDTPTLQHHEEKVRLAAAFRREYEQRFRTDLLLELWDFSESEAQALGYGATQRVLRMVHCQADSALLQRELDEVRKVCAKALNLAKLEYLCLNPCFRELLAPLDIFIPSAITISAVRSVVTESSRQSIASAKKALESSLRWTSPSKACIENIVNLWRSKYEPIVLLDVRYATGEIVPLSQFLRNCRSSLEVSVALMKMSLVCDIDVSMMTDLEGSSITYTYVNAAEYSESRLKKLFCFVQAFLQTNLKRLVEKSARMLEDVFALPECNAAVFGVESDNYFQIIGVKRLAKAELLIELRFIEGGRVKVFPEIERLEGELLELLDDTVKEINKFTKPDIQVMSSLQLPQATIDVVSTKDNFILSAKEAIRKALAFALPFIQNLCEVYGKHAALVEKFVVEESDYFKDDFDNAATIQRIESEVVALRKILDQVKWTSQDIVSCGVLCVDCSQAKRTLLSLWDGKIRQILEMLESRIYSVSNQAVRICKKMKHRLTTRPTCVEELDELLAYSDDAKRAVKVIREKDVVEVVSWVALVERLQHAVAEEVFAQAYQLASWPDIMDEVLQLSEELFVSERSTMSKELEEYKVHIHQLVAELDSGVVALLGTTEQEKSDVAVTLSKSLRSLCEEIEQRIVVASRREAMLGLPLTDFGSFLPVKSTFEALEQFWTTLVESSEQVQRFYDTPIADANAERMIEQTEKWRRLIRAATRSLRGYPPLLALGRKHEHFLMQFEQATPLVEMLTQPGVRQPHWKDISKKLGLPAGRELLSSDPSVTVQRVLTEGAMNSLDDISAIVSQAATDFAAETRLEKMKSETRRQLLVFETLEMPVGQVNALANSSEIVALLDSFVAQSQHLHSRFNLQAGLAQMTADWENTLLAMQETMTTWMTLQTDWLQLRPTVLVPVEATSVVSADMVQKFRQVDEQIRQIIDELDRPNQNLFVVMTIETLPNRLLNVSNQLRVIREGILLLMDSKRTAFPRFYFLNDKELLSCLSALNIRAVIGLLQRMYPRLHSLDLYKGDVSGFVSCDGVRMRCEPNYPVTSEPIETWMCGLEGCLIKALRSAIEFCLADFSRTQARVWLLRYCGQLIDVVLRIRYNMDLEEVLNAVGTIGLKAYLTKSSRLLEEYFHVSAADLGSSEHRTVANSVAFMLACREEVQAMIEDGVHTVDNLETFPVFRTALVENSKRIVVKLFHTTIPYGNEFLGNYSVPVSTPVMFRTARALFLSQISCTKTMLTGSGGVGKKQTMTDIATFLGTFLWSVQCHSALTTVTLAPLLRALVGVGGWLCLDDVNLLSPAVQTEMCTILSMIDAAQKKKNRGPKQVSLPLGKNNESVILTVDARFNLVATASVPYTELPAVIVEAFRPIFLQPVDFSVVAKAHLCSLGFENEFVSLGDAIGGLFQQFHDVVPGTFSVKSLLFVLRTARTLTAPTLAGKIAQALRRLLGPTLCHDPALEQLFEARVSALGDEEGALVASFATGPAESLTTHSLFDFEKLMQLTYSVIVFGPHYSGKCRIITEWGKKRNCVLVCPRTVSSAMYYGGTDAKSGLLASIFKECSVPGEHLLWFEDAAIDNVEDSLWCQCVSSQRNVYLDASTCVVMGAETCVVASCTSLKDAAPSIVSRFALFCSGGALPWQEHLRLHSSVLVDAEMTQSQLAISIIEVLLPLLLGVVCKQQSFHDAATLALTFAARWYQYTLSSTQTARLTSDKLTAFMVQCTVFATAWTTGLGLDSSDRQLFEDAFLDAHEAVSAIVCQYDSTIEIFPPGDILSFVATAGGWKAFVVDDTTDTWCHDELPETKQQRAWSLFARPANPVSHHYVEVLLRCGQPIYLTGNDQSGKTHILKRCGTVPGWIAHFVACNKDSGVSLLQETLAPRLQRRQNKIYGPNVGKQLVICVDDLHLCAHADPQEVDANSGPLSHVLAFLARRQRLATVAYGTIGLRDSVFVATGASLNWHSYFSRSALEVRLPPVRGSHVIHCVWTLLERCSMHRNVSDIGRDAATFLIVLHDAFVRASLGAWKTDSGASTTKDQRPYVFLENLRQESQVEEAAEDNDHTIDDDDDEDIPEHSPLSHPWVRIAEPNANKDVHKLFQALDAVRHMINSTIPDTQLLRGIVCEAYRTYSSEVEPSRKEDVARLVLDVAQRTISATERSLASPDDVSASVIVTTETNTVERLQGPARDKRISDWIACYNKAPAVEVTPLLTPFTNVSQVSLTNSHGGLAAFRNKMTQSYKFNQMVLTASGASHATQQSSSLSQLQQQEPTAPVAPSTKTMITAWLQELLPQMLSMVHLPESHIALVGSQVFGVTRLVRIAAAISNIPLQLCRCDVPFYDYSCWRADVKSLLRYSAKKAVRVALFVPNSVLSIPGVLSDIDFLVRTGSSAPYFSSEEYTILLDTAKKTHTMAGSSDKIDPSVELDTRIRTQTHFIIHIPSEKALAQAKLGFPAVTSVMQKVLIGNRWNSEDHNPTFVDIAASSLISSYSVHLPPAGSEDASGNYVAVAEMPTEAELTPVNSGRTSHTSSMYRKHSLNLVSEVDTTAAVVCEVFQMLAQDDTGIVEEQLVEFAQLVGLLQKKRIPELTATVDQLSRFQGIKKTIQECIDTDTASRKTLAPEFDQLNEGINRLERSVTSQTTVVEGHRRAFETLEGTSMQMVAAIDSKKQQIAQLYQTMESKLQEARSALAHTDPKHIKALAGTIVPPTRARVLMDAVFLILGEDHPKSATTQQELWNVGRKLVCEPSFLPRILNVHWDSPWLPSFDQLRPLIDNFDVARFGTFSPYSQAIADLITALAGCLAMKEKCTELEVHMSDSRAEVLSLVDDLERARDTLYVSSKKLDDDRTKLATMRDRRTVVYDALQRCEQRLIRLHRLATFVESYELLVKKPLEQLEAHLRCIVGDIILSATRIALLGCQTQDDADDSLASVRRKLDEHGIAYSESDIHEHMLFVFQQEPLILSSYMLAVRLPQPQLQLLAALSKRLFFRWPLFCAVNTLFEDCIIQQLRDSCNDVVVANASSRNLTGLVGEAIKQGYGVVVRHFNGSDVLERLGGVMALLPTMLQHGIYDDWTQDPLTIQGPNSKPTTVHPKFYLVFTAREAHGELAIDALRSLQQWLVVLRCNGAVDTEAIVQHHIFNHKQGSCVTMMNEYRTRAKEQRVQTSEFYKGKFLAGRLIADRQEAIADDEATIAELGVEVGRMERAAVQIERQRQMADNVLSDVHHRWDQTVVAVSSLLRALSRMERKLGRDPLQQAFLADVIEGGFVASQFMQEKYHVDKVTSLPEYEQPKFVVLSFLERVLSIFGPGWPTLLKHIFALLLMSCTQHSSAIADPQRMPTESDETLSPTASIAGADAPSDPLPTSDSRPLSLGDIDDILQLIERIDGSTAFAPLSKTAGSLLNAAALRSSSLSADIQRSLALSDALLHSDLLLANEIAQSLIPQVSKSLFGVVTDRHGAERTSTCVTNDLSVSDRLAPLFRFCSLSSVATYLETDDMASMLGYLQGCSRRLALDLAVTHLHHNSVDVDGVLLKMAQSVRSRPTKDCVGSWHIIVLESCATPGEVEMRAEMVQRIVTTLGVLRDLYYTTLCNQKPNDETQLCVTFLVDHRRTPKDVELLVRHRSMHISPVFEITTPKQHIDALLSHPLVISEDDWETIPSHPFHFKLNCLLKGLVLLHAHQMHRQRLSRWRARTFRMDISMCCTDQDLVAILGVLHFAFVSAQDPLAVVDPFSVMRHAATLIYAARSLHSVEEERLLKVATKFVNRQSIVTSFRFMDSYESDPDLKLSAFHQAVRFGSSDLCELSGDVLASEQAVREQLRSLVEKMTAGDQSQVMRRKSSVVSSVATRRGTASRPGNRLVSFSGVVPGAQRSRKSFFVPAAPAFRRSFAKIVQRRRSSQRLSIQQIAEALRTESSLQQSQGDSSPSQSEADLFATDAAQGSRGFYRPDDPEMIGDDYASWKLELAALSTAIEASGQPPGESESRMVATLTKLMHTPPTQVREMWLPALQFPKLFLHTFMFARADEIVRQQKAVYATFVLVCVPSEERLQPGDLLLYEARLPERRLRNQPDAAHSLQRRRSNPGLGVSLFGDDSDISAKTWLVPEDEVNIVLRACPRSSIPYSSIPMLRTDNLLGRPPIDDNDKIGFANSGAESDSAPHQADSVALSDTLVTPRTLANTRLDRVESPQDQQTTLDFLAPGFVGGKGFQVFLSRVDVPLMCCSVAPQTGKRKWRSLLDLPLLVERPLPSRAPSLRTPSLNDSSTPLVPSAPSFVKPQPSFRMARRNQSLSEGTPDTADLKVARSRSASFADKATPPADANADRFFWLPVGLHYVATVE